MIKIKYKRKTYDIDKEKLLTVLSKLTLNCKESKIISQMKRYKLYNKDFLENINKL